MNQKISPICAVCGDTIPYDSKWYHEHLGVYMHTGTWHCKGCAVTCMICGHPYPAETHFNRQLSSIYESITQPPIKRLWVLPRVCPSNIEEVLKYELCTRTCCNMHPSMIPDTDVPVYFVGCRGTKNSCSECGRPGLLLEPTWESDGSGPWVPVCQLCSKREVYLLNGPDDEVVHQIKIILGGGLIMTYEIAKQLRFAARRASIELPLLNKAKITT